MTVWGISLKTMSRSHGTPITGSQDSDLVLLSILSLIIEILVFVLNFLVWIGLLCLAEICSGRINRWERERDKKYLYTYTLVNFKDIYIYIYIYIKYIYLFIYTRGLGLTMWRIARACRARNGLKRSGTSFGFVECIGVIVPFHRGTRRAS